MIRSISSMNHKRETIKMELASPETSGFIVRDVTGLGPVKSNIYISEFGSSDGGYFQSSRMPSRTILLDLVFYGANIERIRERAYLYFPVQKKVQLTIETTEKTLAIDGYVESNEPNIFSSAESTMVSIRCPDPYFRLVGDEAESSETFTSNQPLFEFPFSNDSLTEPLLEFGEITSYVEKNLYYSGDGENGLKIHVDFLGPVINPRFHIRNTNQKLGLNTVHIEALTGAPITSGDMIDINTKRGEKSIILTRGTNAYNIIGAISPDSTWLSVDRGDNVFTYQVDSGFDNMSISVTTTPLYLGV